MLSVYETYLSINSSGSVFCLRKFKPQLSELWVYLLMAQYNNGLTI